MKRQLTVVLACFCLASSPTWAANGNINLSFDPDAATCQGSVCPNGTTTIYVHALLQGASGPGITGAEYSVQLGPDALPDSPNWQFFENFPMGATALGQAFNPPDGDPSGERGVNIAFSQCQTGDGTKVLLETVQVLGDCNDPELPLKVVKHTRPANNQFQCPLFTLCDAPTFTKVCLGSNVVTCRNPDPPFPMNANCSTSGEGFLNPVPGRNCTVGVQQSTWSTVKELYRAR